MKTKLVCPYRIRPLLAADVLAIAQIERLCFSSPWDSRQIDPLARSPSLKAWVVDYSATESSSGAPAGWFLYRRHDHGLRLVRLAVAPGFARRGIGGLVIDYLGRHVFAGDAITASVPEREVAAQIFLRRMQFRCIGQRRAACLETQEDLYDFERVIKFGDF